MGYDQFYPYHFIGILGTEPFADGSERNFIDNSHHM